MRLIIALAILTLSSGASVQALQPGDWDVRSTVVQLAVPGMPGFIQRMARGKPKAERKRLAAGQGVEALLAPDPKRTAGPRVANDTLLAAVEAGAAKQALSTT